MDSNKLEKALVAMFGEAGVKRNEPMAAHTTFKCGGPADYLVEPKDEGELIGAIRAAEDAGARWYVIGCGSNLLVSDDGLRGLVVKLGSEYSRIEIDGVELRVQAGATNREVAEAAHDAGLAGYEFASGIPGSIGGAAYMNAGAYDGEFKDVAVGVRCLAPNGEVVELSADDAKWSYRHSMMQDEGYIVLEATLRLHEGSKDEIRAIMEDLRQRRESKQPLELGSAGSTFKRPEGYFAGKLIQDAGMRGHKVGGAQVSEKHAGFVVNVGGATAADVRQVIRDVQDAVFQMEGVRLEPEVRMWGFED